MNLAPVKAAAERESLNSGAASRLIHRTCRSAKPRVIAQKVAMLAA
jgi:hypothetical protein